jgi:ubiquitin-conjugating enzyme E2 S
LNEEAGKLLLENYEDYAKHAKLMTSIHAKLKAPSTTAPSATPSTATKDAAVVKKTTQVPTKQAAEKKKSLKRL